MAPEKQFHVINLTRDQSRETRQHRHHEGELVLLRSGIIALETARDRWVMPPGRIGWIPPNYTHGARSHGPIRGTSLYLAPPLCMKLPREPAVLRLSGLADAVLERLASLPAAAAAEDRRARLCLTLIDEVVDAEREPLHLPMPQDFRLMKMAFALLADPGDRRDLDAWARAIGMSRRSLIRHFRQETGLTFGRWRQQARLMKAIELLSRDESVTTVALSLGYESVSSFIATFRKFLGTTPNRFRSVRPPGVSGAANPTRSEAPGR